MTMNYRSRTKNNQLRQTGTVLVVALVLLVIATLTKSLWIDAVFSTIENRVQVGDTFMLVFQEKRDLVNENHELKAQLEERTLALELATYNQRLVKELLSENKREDDTTAQVLLRPPYSAYDHFILNVGHNDRVREQQLITRGGQFAMGYISEVGREHARAVLFSAPGEEMLVSVDGNLYEARGEGGGSISVRLPRNFRDNERSVVSLPGAGSYIIGFLETTSFEPQDSYVRGVVSMPFNIFESDWVTVTQDQYQSQQNLEGLVKLLDEETEEQSESRDEE